MHGMQLFPSVSKKSHKHLQTFYRLLVLNFVVALLLQTEEG